MITRNKQPQIGDYVSFTRVVAPAVKQKIRDSFGGNHDAVITDRRIVDQRGSGLVLRVSSGESVVGDAKVRTMRVDAGPWLKTVTAVLDDTVELLGEQMGLGIEVANARVAAAGMYGTDVKGGA